jgi:hypothetical protein
MTLKIKNDHSRQDQKNHFKSIISHFGIGIKKNTHYIQLQDKYNNNDRNV